MHGPLRLAFQTTDLEHARSWLADAHAGRGGRARALAGPALFALGALLHAVATEDLARALGSFALLFGGYLAVRPFLLALVQIRLRRHEGLADVRTEVVLDDDGVRVLRPAPGWDAPWHEVTGAGRDGAGYWVEAGERRVRVPQRAVPDAAALERALRERGVWSSGPGAAAR